MTLSNLMQKHCEKGRYEKEFKCWRRVREEEIQGYSSPHPHLYYTFFYFCLLYLILFLLTYYMHTYYN